MDDVVELNLTRAVNVTNTTFIRASVQARIEADGLKGPAVELVQFHVFIHCTRGSGEHMVDFQNHEMKPDTAIWIRPGQVQQWSNVHNGFDANVVVFESSSVLDLPLFDHLLGATHITQLGDDADRLQQQINWMAADLEEHQDHATAAAVVSVILRLFARQAQRDNPTTDTPARRLTTAFLESIDRDIDERSVSWHAQQVGASTRSISRATIETLGQRPKELIDTKVILEAQRRLAWSSDDIATIARALRFSEASNFTKFFRTRTGTSPSAFRDTVTELVSKPDRRNH